MKKIIPNLLFLVILMTSCSPTMKMLQQWNSPELDVKKYKNLGVILMSPNVNNKVIVETELAQELVNNGVKASATFDIFAFAGNQETLSEITKDLTEEEREQRMKDRVNKFEFDALLIISVLDKKQITERRGGNVGVGIAAPYAYSYAGYYSYSYAAISTPSYYTTTTTFVTESSLFDVASEDLVWSGQSKVVNPDDLNKNAKDFSQLIVSEMLKEAK